MTEVPKKQKKSGAKPKVEEQVEQKPILEQEPIIETRVELQAPDEAPQKEFTASQGRLRKLFYKAGLSGRIAKDVFEMLDKKIKCLVEQRVKSLKIKDKKIIYDELAETNDEGYELPITPFREYLKSTIRKEHDITRVSPDVVELLHSLVERDIIKLCQYAQDIMKNSSRKTLFANDIEVASKALI